MRLRHLPFAAAALALLAAPARAQLTERPERIEEVRAVGLVRVLHTGDVDSVVDFLQENLAPAAWSRRSADHWRGMAGNLIRDLGGAELEGVVITRPHALRLVLGTAQGPRQAITLGFEFEGAAPYRIATLAVEMGGPDDERERFPPFDLPEGADRGAVTDALTRYFADLAAADRFSGTALVALRGEVIFSAAHGLASRRFNAPNRLETRFDLGSINKAFTKIAIGQLRAAGTLSLTDHIADHLPDYPNADVAAQITIQQLLDHTSGLGDIFNDRFQRSSRAQYRAPRDYFPVFADEPLLFAPGSGRQYSNAGYIVLGAIIEVVSGMPYDEYVRQHIFAPAGMTRSGFFPRDVPEPDVAEGYTRWIGGGPERRSNQFQLPIKGNPAGSAQSTVGDLLRFDTALREHRLLSPPYTAWFFGGPVPEPGATVVPARETTPIGIAGGGPGVSAVLESDGALIVTILSNYDPPTAEAIARQLVGPLRQALR